MTTEWRPAVIRVMADSAASDTLVRRRLNSRPFNYRWEHVTTVVTLALRLADLVGADRDIIEAAAWLHDVTKKDGKRHARSGAAFAQAFLARTDFPPDKIQQVAQAIADHRGLYRAKPLTRLESMVLWDADKLSKIGLTAAFHWTGMVLAGERISTAADLIAKGRKAGWQEKTVASMHTAPARRAALRRMTAFNRHWSALEAELLGYDLVNGEQSIP